MAVQFVEEQNMRKRLGAFLFCLSISAFGATPPPFSQPGAWKGGVADAAIHKVWPQSICWRHGQSSGLGCSFKPAQDWSKFGTLSFWLHSEKATGSHFMLILPSENPSSEGADYYSFRITLDWTGWKQFVLPFNELGAAREPIGWKQIEGIRFTASGYGNTPDPVAVVRLDGLELSAGGGTGQRMTDRELFADLDLDLPQLAAVKRAVQSGDLTAASSALASHVRSRTSPRWFFDWRDHPFRGVKVPPPEADRAPESWDYYSTYLTIDWQGWKHISLKKSDFSPKYVEGKGWVGKQPIGWNWIRHLSINASGWSLKPNPQTLLYFDDIQLVGRSKTVTVGDFERDAARWEGLTPSPAHAKSGQFGGAWEDQTLNPRVHCANIPHDWTDFDSLDFWVYSAKATGSRVILVLDSEPPGNVAAAEKVLQHKFDYTQGPGKRGTLDFGPKIDWKANPTEGEARTHLWNESLNRHFHFRTLADAYWQTGQDKYAKEIADQILDWTASNPRVMLSSGNGMSNGCEAWQTLTTGIRLADTWPTALYRCLGSPAFSDEALCALVKSVCEQARHLVRWPSRGNWLTAESNGLLTAGVLFPEFREAGEWRRIALVRLYQQLDDEVYPDGMEYELAAGYNNWVVAEFAHVLELMDLNDRRSEVPADFQKKMEKMFNYLLFASMPNGQIPGLNDSGNADVRGLLTTGFKLFPKRQDFEFVATGGASGRAPAETSHAFPYSGHYVMRSGWDKEATYLLFDAGPYGFGHQHEDKLHFVLWAHGRQLVLDPGNFSYDRSRWRRYVLSTAGHNTVMVDGQNQHRSGQRDTYFWERPWTTPAPLANDARWVSTPRYDLAVGVYTNGYGPKNAIAVTHQRQVLFLKAENLFVVADTLTPQDTAEHRYEALFHLDTTNALVDGSTKTVRSDNADGSNVGIIPLADGKLSVEIVKGKEDEPVQGWANSPWRAIPTAIYRKSAPGVVRFLFVLEPTAKGAQASVRRVESMAKRDPVHGARIVFADGRALEVGLSDTTTQVALDKVGGR